MAWALRGAAGMDHWWSENSRLDVLWTGPSPASNTFRRTEQALLEILASAKRELWLVSFAGYKLPDVRNALVAAAERDVQVRMVIESPEESQGEGDVLRARGVGGSPGRSSGRLRLAVGERSLSADGLARPGSTPRWPSPTGGPCSSPAMNLTRSTPTTLNMELGALDQPWAVAGEGGGSILGRLVEHGDVQGGLRCDRNETDTTGIARGS